VVQPLWECWLVDGPSLGVFGGCEAAEGRVGSVGVVLDPPRLDEHLGFEEGADIFDVQPPATAPAAAKPAHKANKLHCKEGEAVVKGKCEKKPK